MYITYLFTGVYPCKLTSLFQNWNKLLDSLILFFRLLHFLHIIQVSVLPQYLICKETFFYAHKIANLIFVGYFLIESQLSFISCDFQSNYMRISGI